MAGTMGSMLKPLRVFHFIRLPLLIAVAALVVTGGAVQRLAQSSTAPSSTFLVFFRSMPVGNEQISVEKTAAGWSINSSGRVGPPFDLLLRSLGFKSHASVQTV